MPNPLWLEVKFLLHPLELCICFIGQKRKLVTTENNLYVLCGKGKVCIMARHGTSLPPTTVNCLSIVLALQAESRYITNNRSETEYTLVNKLIALND